VDGTEQVNETGSIDDLSFDVSSPANLTPRTPFPFQLAGLSPLSISKKMASLAVNF
jgi:hypothetical protein